MQSTSEHLEHAGPPTLRSRARRSAVRFAALALILGTLSSVAIGGYSHRSVLRAGRSHAMENNNP